MIAKKKLQNLYYQMLRIRKVEEAIADEYGKKLLRQEFVPILKAKI